MNPLNPADWYQSVVEWMAYAGIDKGGKVNVDDAVRGVKGAVAPTRDAVKEVLETLLSDGFLSRDGSNFKLTDEGERNLYPGTDVDLVEDVIADIKNYVNQQASSKFDYDNYKTQIIKRLNPRQARMVAPVIQVLVNEGYWKLTGRRSYTVIG
ncbi:hypothetical protein [Stenotrophomonas sp.]|uniref:hypothetical protein n=1 Tax=Stenotrophomonas sp. TaxID=69392 RepID=UPI0028A5A3C4|nr:hypothetical protein [Stenotrophomonas sp.]